MDLLRRFGRFLYDFLVGDAWELFLGPIIVLVIAWGLLRAGMPDAIVGLFLFVGVLGTAGLNLVLALRDAR